MSGVTALVDTLLATRLAQRVDLVPLKPQGEVAGPEAASRVEKVANDVRLPSRAALEQLGVDVSGNRSTKPDARSSGSAGVTLSAVARAISALLDPQTGPALKIRSAEPLWREARPPVAQQLTARLTQAVVYSGLFYEAHLQQFATGLRTLDQLAREPQAGLTPAALPTALTDAAEVPLAAGRPAQGSTASPVITMSAAEGQPVPAEPLQHPAVYGRDGKPGKSLPPVRDMAGPVIDTKTPIAGQVADKDSSSAVAAAIHPDAVGLVRQQLELLSVPVFRWSGEAWPGTPMDWEVQEEQAEDAGTSTNETPEPAAWTTNLTLTLPMLKSVQARLTLAGDTLLVRLTSDEVTTLAVLDRARDALTGRFGALGLQVTSLQVGVPDASVGPQNGTVHPA